MADVPARVDGKVLQAFLRPAAGVDGFDGLSERDLGTQAPVLRLRQPMSIKRKDTAKAGQYSLGSINVDGLTVVFLKVRPYRVLWEGDQGKQSITCGSADGLVPDPGLEDPKDKACADRRGNAICDWAKWDEPVPGQRKPPPCSAGYAYLGVWPEQGKAFWFLCGKTGWKPAWQFNRDIIAWNANKPREEAIRGICDLAVTLGVEEKQRPGGGVFYVPTFAPVLLPVGERATYRAMYDAVKDAVYSPIGGPLEGDETVVETTGTPTPDDPSQAPF